MLEDILIGICGFVGYKIYLLLITGSNRFTDKLKFLKYIDKEHYWMNKYPETLKEQKEIKQFLREKYPALTAGRLRGKDSLQ